MAQDEEQLRLLSIFHYVVGGLVALTSFFPLIYLVIGLVLISNPQQFTGKGDPSSAFVGWFFVAFASVFILCGLTLATLMMVAGRNYAHRRGYNFCFAIACIECIYMPFGTALGVFSIIVLTRESVKQLFFNPAGGD